jgi:hypothetical protein
MPSFQQRLKRVMRRRDERVADLARAFGRPYTTVREWVENGREPVGPVEDRREIMKRLEAMERTP